VFVSSGGGSERENEYANTTRAPLLMRGNSRVKTILKSYRGYKWVLLLGGTCNIRTPPFLRKVEWRVESLPWRQDEEVHPKLKEKYMVRVRWEKVSKVQREKKAGGKCDKGKRPVSPMNSSDLGQRAGGNRG